MHKYMHKILQYIIIVCINTAVYNSRGDTRIQEALNLMSNYNSKHKSCSKYKDYDYGPTGTASLGPNPKNRSSLRAP